MQVIDLLLMHSMSWLHAHLISLRDEGYTIDSVVVHDGEVIIVRHRTSDVLDGLDITSLPVYTIEAGVLSSVTE